MWERLCCCSGGVVNEERKASNQSRDGCKDLLLVSVLIVLQINHMGLSIAYFKLHFSKMNLVSYQKILI